MSDDPQSSAPSRLEIETRLHEVGRTLRDSRSIDLAARQALLELTEELHRALQKEDLPAAELTALAETTVQLADSLHRQEEQGIVSKARDGLERAVENAEAHAPIAVGLARQLLDALANLGI